MDLRTSSPARASRDSVRPASRTLPSEESLAGMMKEVVSEEVQKLREHLDLEIAQQKGAGLGLLATTAAFSEGQLTPVHGPPPPRSPGGSAALASTPSGAAESPSPAPRRAAPPAEAARPKRAGQRKLTWSAAVVASEDSARGSQGAAERAAKQSLGGPKSPSDAPASEPEPASEQLVGICDTVMTSLARVQEMIGSAAHQPEVAKSPNPESNARLEKLVRTLKKARKKAEGGERRGQGTERSEEELKYHRPGQQGGKGLDYGKSRRSPVQNRRVTIRATWGREPGTGGASKR